MVNQKKTILAVILIAFISSFSFSQDNTVQNTAQQTETTVNTDFDNYFYGTDSENTTNSDYKPTPTWKYLLRTVIVLILIVAAIWALMKFFKAKGKIDTNKSEDGYLRRVSTLNLGPNKSIEVITIVDKGYLVGVTDENINLLAEINDKELVEAMNINLNKQINSKKPVNFADVLKSFTSAGRTTESIYSDAEEKISNLNTKQDVE